MAKTQQDVTDAITALGTQITQYQNGVSTLITDYQAAQVNSQGPDLSPQVSAVNGLAAQVQQGITALQGVLPAQTQPADTTVAGAGSDTVAGS